MHYARIRVSRFVEIDSLILIMNDNLQTKVY